MVVVLKVVVFEHLAAISFMPGSGYSYFTYTSHGEYRVPLKFLYKFALGPRIRYVPHCHKKLSGVTSLLFFLWVRSYFYSVFKVCIWLFLTLSRHFFLTCRVHPLSFIDGKWVWLSLKNVLAQCTMIFICPHRKKVFMIVHESRPERSLC